MIDAEPTKRTLGVDLASQPGKTGICVVEWDDGRATVKHLASAASDEAILDLHHSCDITGIDMPFGWPEPFVDFLLGNPSADPEEWSDTWKKKLRFRRTDFAVHKITGRWPLSVSSDRIAIPAMRCKGLLSKMGVTDLSGVGACPTRNTSARRVEQSSWDSFATCSTDVHGLRSTARPARS